MNWRHCLLLTFLNGIVLLVVFQAQHVPGYMDASYYFIGGQQLAKGEGFVEPILWNYLGDPAGLPHPSHGYWMPFASMVAVLGMTVFNNLTFASARFGFILFALAVPILTAFLSYQLTNKSEAAILAGVLAIFSGYYLPFMITTDTFAIMMLLGSLTFLLLNKPSLRNVFILGVLTGIFYLSRADGLIWLPAIGLVIFFNHESQTHNHKIKAILLLIIGFCVISGPWMYRNYQVFGTPFSPDSTKLLWITDYDQIFTYPADKITFRNWFSNDLMELVTHRFWSLRLNSQRVLAEQGLIFLTPLIILGMWRARSDLRIRFGFLVWLVTFGIMTLLFPFAGARGGLFHSSAAFQPLFWAVTPIGLTVFVEWGQKYRGWHPTKPKRVFGIAIVLLSAILSGYIFFQGVIGFGTKYPIWEKPTRHYEEVDLVLQRSGAKLSDVVMVKNPPEYYLASNREAVVIPDGNVDTLLSAASRYDVRYVILEYDHSKMLNNLYQSPLIAPDNLVYLQAIEETRIFEIK